MNIQGLVIQTDGSHELRTIESYVDIREAVGGDFDWASPGPATYYCYEYALFERPCNPVATVLYHTTHPDITDPMHGPVLITGPVRDEDDTDVPEEIVTWAQEIREQLGQAEIDRLAVPMTPAQQMEFQTKMIVAQNQATAALREGLAVDFGGIYLGAERDLGAMPADPFTADDGNRRQGKQ